MPLNTREKLFKQVFKINLKYFHHNKKIVYLQPQNLKERRLSTMLIIPVKEGENIDRALKRFKRKFDRTGGIRQLRARQHFVKPSVERRALIQKAQYIQRLREQEEI